MDPHPRQPVHPNELIQVAPGVTKRFADCSRIEVETAADRLEERARVLRSNQPVEVAPGVTKPLADCSRDDLWKSAVRLWDE